MERQNEKLFLTIRYSVSNNRVSFSAYFPTALGDKDRQYICDGMVAFGSELAGLLEKQGVGIALEFANNGVPAIALKTDAHMQDVGALIRKADEVKYRIPAVLQYHTHGVSTMTDRDAEGVPKWHELYEIRLEEAKD